MNILFDKMPGKEDGTLPKLGLHSPFFIAQALAKFKVTGIPSHWLYS